MLKSEIEEFARTLIQEVRDRSILSCDSQINLRSNSPVAKRWRPYLDGKSSNLASSMIPDCIDAAVFHLLAAIDAGALRLSFVASNGRTVDLTHDGMGELAGWYMLSQEGWRAKYAEQRFIDDLEDLTYKGD